MKRSSFKPKPCAECGSIWHSKGAHRPPKGFQARKRKLRYEALKTKAKRLKTADEWDKLNPPDHNGQWICYLQISPYCPVTLSRETMVREHVEPKNKRPDLKYDVNNLKPSCSPCNKLKAGRSLHKIKPSV